MPVQGAGQDEAAFDEPEPLDDEDDEPDEEEDDEDDPESLDDELDDEDEEDDESDDSDLPAFTVLLVDVLRESVR
ncbi:hypothetical protein [Promicromonospora sukumoe]